MEISEGAAKYIYKSILAICATTVVCIVIYAYSNRYKTTSTGLPAQYITDTWTGQSWFIRHDNRRLVEEEN